MEQIKFKQLPVGFKPVPKKPEIEFSPIENVQIAGQKIINTAGEVVNTVAGVVGTTAEVIGDVVTTAGGGVEDQIKKQAESIIVSIIKYLFNKIKGWL